MNISLRITSCTMLLKANGNSTCTKCLVQCTETGETVVKHGEAQLRKAVTSHPLVPPNANNARTCYQ